MEELLSQVSARRIDEAPGAGKRRAKENSRRTSFSLGGHGFPSPQSRMGSPEARKCSTVYGSGRRRAPTPRRRENARHAGSRQRDHSERRSRRGHAAALVPPRRARSHRDQVRLRHWCLRRLYSTPRRPRGSKLPDSALRDPGQSRHHDRRPEQHRHAPSATGLARAQRPAVRILPERPDHASGLAPRHHAVPDRRRYRRLHARQYLPLRDLPPHPRRHSRRRYIGHSASATSASGGDSAAGTNQ